MAKRLPDRNTAMQEKWVDRLTTNIDPREGACPIIHRQEVAGGHITRVLGTVFFISRAGLFITAKHVVDEYPENPCRDLSVVLLHRPHFKIGKVMCLAKHPATDLAVGLVDLRSDGWAPTPFALSSRPAAPGTLVCSFGYPRTEEKRDGTNLQIQLHEDFFEGEVLDYHRSGFSIARWPVYRHNMSSSAGISGAPVFGRADSLVYGVCCTGFDPPPGGTFSDILPLLDWPLHFVGDKWNTIRGVAQHRPDMIALRP